MPVITPAVLAPPAVREVDAYARPRGAIVSTGDEVQNG